MPLRQAGMYPQLYYEDCERLGLMRQPTGPDDPGDRLDLHQRWSAHCQRHFGQRLSQNLRFPDVWNHHFRGDKLGDARDHYYRPEPQEVRKMYLELVPRMGFQPLPGAPRVREGSLSLEETHRTILTGALIKSPKRARCISIDTQRPGEGVWVVPQRFAPSILYALSKGRPDAQARILPETSEDKRRWLNRVEYEEVLHRALALRSPGQPTGTKT